MKVAESLTQRMAAFRERNRATAKRRRAERTAEGRCINDTADRSHGPIVKSGRCERCNLVHTRSR